MQYKKLLSILLLLATVVPCTPVTASTAPGTDNLSIRLGKVTQESIAKAIDKAKEQFKINPRQIVIIDIPRGTFDLSRAQGAAAIDVSNVNPQQGWLIFRGYGPQNTILTFNKSGTWIRGANCHRIAFQNMQMRTDKMVVSQGHVVSVDRGKVVLRIQPGFPTPGDIFEPNAVGKWMRQFTDDRENPLIVWDPVLPRNEQIEWKTTQQVGDRDWQMNLVKPELVAPYKRGDLIGIKSRQTGNTYFFFNSSDIVFESVQWMGKSRGVFRGGTKRVTILNCVIDRAPAVRGQTPCLSTPDGGPQIGNPADDRTGGHRVENCHFVATGDDSIAFFKANGKILNNRIRDSFGRGILLYLSPNVELENNELRRCPVLNML